MSEIVRHFMTQEELNEARDTVAAMLKVRPGDATPEFAMEILDAVANAVIDAWQEREIQEGEEITAPDNSCSIRATKLPGGIHQIAVVSQAMKKRAAIKSAIRRLSMM